MNILSAFIHNNKTAVKNYLFRIIQFAFRQGVTFFIIFLSAKLLSTYEFGVFSFSLATIMFFSVLSDFGISRTTSKFVTEELINRQLQPEEVFFNGLAIILVFSSACTVFLLLFSELILDEFSIYLGYILPMVFLFPLSSLFDGFYLGQKKFNELSKIFSFTGVIALGIDSYLIVEYGLIGALISINVFYFLLLIVFLFKHQKRLFTVRKNTIKKILHYALFIGLPGIGYFLFTRANVYLLGKLNFIVESGYYEFIDRAFVAASFPFLMFGQVLAPTITEKVALNENKQVLLMFRKIFRAAAVIAIVFALIFYLVFPHLLAIFYPQYSNEGFLTVFYILILLLPFMLMTDTLNEPFIVGSGLAKISLLTIPFGILNVILGITLVKFFGYLGILYSTLFCSITQRLISYFLVYKRLIRRVN